MPQRSKKASSGGSLKQYRRAREDELRRKFKGVGGGGDKVWLWWREVFGSGGQPVQ